jgi:TetR/AcrR family transcriptional regulator, regulator of biofilm formation and stress response
VPTERRGAARRRELLDATLRVIGRGGLAGVDHRAVAAEAGVPLGSTTYYFSSKDDMVTQTFAHVAEQEDERLAGQRHSLEEADAGAVSERLTDIVIDAVSIDRIMLLAQYELYLESARRDDLRAAAERWDSAYAELFELALEKAGSPDPAGRGRLLCVALDGLVLQHMALDGEPDELRSRARELVRLFAAAQP